MSHVFLLAGWLAGPVWGQAGPEAPFVYEDEDLRAVIADVEGRTAWRFLYADALVAGKTISVQADTLSLPEGLAGALAPLGVEVEADRERQRILLVPRADPAPPTTSRIVRGRVLDDTTGEPLPFATVTWAGGQRGVVADEAGAFVLTLRGHDAPASLTASFVGYEAQTVAPRGTSLTFRLRPDVAGHPTVVVHALAFAAPVDTVWAAWLRPGRFDAVGEGGGLRALEVLPAVAPAALFDEGPVVRGSPSDAFEVRLDGVPVYNPRHLFGLVDAFNSDALRAVALHLGVAPARVAVAPGGAVDYVTAAGSPRGATAQVGVSSLAARGVVAAPVRAGRTTVLVGGRTSLLDAAPWGDALVEQGLGAVRLTSPLPRATADVLSRVVDVQQTSASFWDLHVGGADERADGGRTALTVYAGGDDTRLDALRFFDARDDETTGPVIQRPVATRNRWGSGALSAVDRRVLAPRLVLYSRLGGSVYDARFARDDFTFNAVRLNPLVTRVDTLGYDNGLREAIAAQRLDAVVGDGLLSGGYSLHLYRHHYEETAADRRTFRTEQSATRLDLHTAWSGRLLSRLDADAGARVHVYSEGGLRLSPRLRARLDVMPGLAVSGAVGRSAQFVHRLTLGDVVGAAAWVLSDSGETVTEADHAEVSVESQVVGVSVQTTAYVKRTRGLWLHAEDRAIRDITDFTVLQRPWLSDVDGLARGVEALVRVPVRPWSLGASAALARAEFQHPLVNDGEAFAADWDRRLRATFLADGPLVSGVRLSAAWTVASGAPNPLAGRRDEADRLDPVSRLDLRLTARHRWDRADLAVSLAVRNVLDRDNPVTREPTTVLRRTLLGETRLGRVPVDVYDTGFLPTVDVTLRW